MNSPSLIVAHLDLKGVQLRHECYDAYLGNLQELGFNALLVEYEDVFPFSNALFSACPEEVWSRDFHQAFLENARARGIEIIPLQQCLSHLEYVFRWPEYQRYSLPHDTPRDLHIGRQDAREWMKEVLEEILAAHLYSRFIHIGMDEARPLQAYAAAEGLDVLPLFLDYLEELCELCARHGKMPLIWSDMLEDHFAPEWVERLLAFRQKVILVPWEYVASASTPQEVFRFSGMRCSREWLANPLEAPATNAPIRDGLIPCEDWPEEIGTLLEEYRVSPWGMKPFFQAALWRKLGFTVWGGAGGSITQDRSLLPYYQRRIGNIAGWRNCAKEYGLEGLILTQWARSNSCSVPNLVLDVVWPILTEAHGENEARKRLGHFYQGVPEYLLERLFHLIGRCREGWEIEATLIGEMNAASPQRHQEEWQSLILMLKIQQAHRRIEGVRELVNCYGGIGRFPGSAWRQHAATLTDARQTLQVLEVETRAHLDKRFYGNALNEWFYKVFNTAYLEIERLFCEMDTSSKLTKDNLEKAIQRRKHWEATGKLQPLSSRREEKN